MAEKKKMPPYIGRNIVVIPIGVLGTVFENAQLIDEKIDEFTASHPEIQLGEPHVNISPSSGGRTVSIDSVSFKRLRGREVC